MRSLKLALVLLNILLTNNLYARITDGQINSKITENTIELTTKKGFHLNAEAPAKIKFDKQAASAEPKVKTEKEFKFDKNKTAKIAELGFFVCDDKKTVCEKQDLKIDLKNNQTKTIENKTALKEYDKAKNLNLESANGKPTLLVFSAPWCPACIRMQTETYPKPLVAAQLAKLNFVKLNSDLTENYDLSEKFRIKAIPTLILLNAKGEEVYRWLDYQPQKDFAAGLKKQMSELADASKLESQALAGNEEAIKKLGLRAFNQMDYAAAAKWFSSGKSDFNIKYKLASEVNAAEDKEKIETLEKAISLTTSKLDKIRWTIDWAEKKLEAENNNSEVINKLKQTYAEIEKDLSADSAARKAFLESTYGDYTGFEKNEVLWMKAKVLELTQQQVEKVKINTASIKEISKKTLTTNQPGEMLLAIAYLREAGDVKAATAFYDKLVKAYPNTYVYFEKYSRFQQKNKNFEQSLQLVNEALKYPQGNLPQLSLLKAQVLIDLGKKDEASSVLDEALKLNDIGHKKFARTVKKIEELKLSLK